MKKIGEIFLLGLGYELERILYIEENKKLCLVDKVWCEIKPEQFYIPNFMPLEFLLPIENSKTIYPKSLGKPKDEDLLKLKNRLEMNRKNLFLFSEYIKSKRNDIYYSSYIRELNRYLTDETMYNNRLRTIYNFKIKDNKDELIKFEIFKYERKSSNR